MHRGRSCEDQLITRRDGRAAGKMPSHTLSESMNDSYRPVKVDLSDSIGQRRAKLRRMTTLSRPSDPLQRSQSLPQKNNAHFSSHSQLTPTQPKPRFVERLIAEDDEAASDDSESPTPRPTKGKGNGKERASSRSPSPKATQASSPMVPLLFSADAVYDREVGEYVIHVSWSYRDAVKDRISDSRVTEIYLGEDDGDDCEFRVVSGVVGVGDFAKEGATRGSSRIDDIDRDDDTNDDWLGRDMMRGIRKNERLVLGGF